MYDQIPKSEWDFYPPKRRVDGTNGNEPKGRTIVKGKKDASIVQGSGKVQG